MILVDTGPIVALLDADDPLHSQCVRTLQHLPTQQLITTWLCFTEAMYLLGSAGGYRYQEVLWRFLQSSNLRIHDLTGDEVERMPELMKKYRDRPMDVADASLMAAAESLSIRRIFSLDSDFYIYRLADGAALEVMR